MCNFHVITVPCIFVHVPQWHHILNYREGKRKDAAQVGFSRRMREMVIRFKGILGQERKERIFPLFPHLLLLGLSGSATRNPANVLWRLESKETRDKGEEVRKTDEYLEAHESRKSRRKDVRLYVGEASGERWRCGSEGTVLLG